jgi:hypothetical protein
MAPARHETPAGAGPPKDSATKTSSIYGTRSSKRKAGDMSTNGESSGQNASSSPSQKSPDAAGAAEPKLPPSKKARRSSSTSIQQPVKTPESITPEEPESQSPVLPENSEIPQIPEVTVDGPSGSSPGDDGASPQKSVGWEEAQVNSEISAFAQDAVPQAVAPITRGRGGGRGRGRGRGGRGGRGRGRGGRAGKARGRGRGAAAVSGHSTPQVSGTPFAKGRGRGRGRNLVAPSIRALYDRKQHLQAQYNAIVKLQKVALAALSEKSLEKLKSNPTYHETLPEYQRVQNILKQNYERHLGNLKQEHERKVTFLKKQSEIEIEYQESKLLVSPSALIFRIFLIVSIEFHRGDARAV